jgi:hypothetical protein
MPTQTGDDALGIQEHTQDRDLQPVGLVITKHPTQTVRRTHRSLLLRKPGFPVLKASTMRLLHWLYHVPNQAPCTPMQRHVPSPIMHPLSLYQALGTGSA